MLRYFSLKVWNSDYGKHISSGGEWLFALTFGVCNNMQHCTEVARKSNQRQIFLWYFDFFRQSV